MNNSVFDNESQQYAARVIASSDEEQMTAMMKEAEALEKELGFVPQKEAQAQEVAQKEQETEAPKFYDYVNKAGEDLKKEVDSTVEQTEDASFGQALEDVGRGMVGGALDFAEGVGNTFIDGVNALEAWAKSKGIDINVMPDDAELTFADEILTPKNPQEAMIRKIGQYLIPFTGAAKMIKAGSPLVKWTKTSLASALISAATIDPDDERLADLIKDVPWVPDLAVQMAEFLQSKPGDTRAEARFKNFTESLITEGIFAGAFFGISKGVKTSKDLYKKFKAGAKPVEEAAEEVAKAGAKEAAEEVAKAGTKEAAEEVAKAGAKEAAEAGAKEAAEAAAKAKPKFKILGPDGQPLPSPVTKMREMIGPKPTDKVVAKIRDAQTADAMLTALRENPGYDNIETLVQSARRGVQDDATVRANAEAILANRKRTEELIKREAGRALNAEETTALRMLWEREFLGLQNLRIKDVKNATPEQLALFQEQLNRFIGVGAQVKGASAELGRGLRTLQQAVEAAPDDAARLSLMNKYMDLNGGPESIKDVAEILNTVLDMNPEDLIENAVKIQKRSLFMRTTDALSQAWMEGIFWSPKTQAANLIGNLFSTLDNVAVTAVQRGAAMTGLAEEVAVKGEVAASLKGMWQGMIEGFGAMKTYLKEGQLEDAVSKFGRIEQNITPQVFGVPETSWLGKTIQGYGYASSIGLRATTAMDVLFRHTNFRMRVNQLLTREAVQMGLEGKAVQDYVKDRLGNVPDHIIKNARKYAEASIFAKPLDEVAFGGVIQSMGEVADKIPMGRAIFPFLRFGGNLADYMMQRTPGMNFISPEFRMALKAGGSRRQEALAKLGLGTSLIGLGAYMAATGSLTGSGPRDYATRKALNAGDKGWQPCSIRFDDGSSWAIDRLAPHGLILCMGADVAEMIGALFDENKEAQYDLIGAAVGIFGTYFTPAVVDDFGDFFGAMKNVRQGEPLTTTATKTMARFFTGMVPFSGGLKEVSKLQDKTRYDTTPGPVDEKSHMESLWKAWEAVKNEWLANNGIPGFSHGLPPQLNIFGEVVHYPPGVGMDLISPIFSNAPEDNKARAEMQRLGMIGPFARQQPAPGGDILKVSMPDRFLTKPIGRKSYHAKLTPHQYHRYVQLSAGIGLGEGVPTLKEAIVEQIENGWPMNEELFGFRRDEKGDIKDAAKIVIIKQIISDYRRTAKDKMYEEFPELADKFYEYGGQRARALGVDFIEGEE